MRLDAAPGMRQLVSRFRLRAGTSPAAFRAAWRAFGEALREAGLVREVGPVMDRCAESGFDTSDAEGGDLIAVMTFEDAARSDAAWAAIEGGRGPVFSAHARVVAKVAEAEFTFWQVP